VARVWAARERATGRAVALKELLSEDPREFAALVREAEMLARFDHPGICAVLDLGTWIDGTPYIVMPRLTGRTLFTAMATARTWRERRALLPAIAAACDALAHAHARGIVHRDVTPANIVVGDDGRVTVIDWGLAAAVDDAEISGTGAYMAPEQLLGLPVDARADVHALGVILGELCGDDARAPARLRALAMRAAAFDRDDRPLDAAAFARELRATTARGRRSYAHDSHMRRRRDRAHTRLDVRRVG
jgi:serine/threonine-protein kinase